MTVIHPEFLSAPWACLPAQLQAMLDAIDVSEGLLARLPEASLPAKRGDRAGGIDPGPVVEDGVATITVAGMLLKSVPWILDALGISATSYDRIASAIAAAEADPAVQSIVIAMDSPGGQAVTAMHEVADALAAATKPTVCYVTDLAASAGYLIASQADEVYAGRGAVLGSIGVFAVAVDSSRAAENAGLKVHVVASGPLKGSASGAPISPEQLKAVQAQVDQQAAMFVAAVARGRGLSDAAAQALATGGTWLAAPAAELGLIDGVAAVRRSADATASPSARAVAAASPTSIAGATPATPKGQPMLSKRLADVMKANSSLPTIVALVLDMASATTADGKPLHSEDAIVSAVDGEKTKTLAAKCDQLLAKVDADKLAHAAALKERDDKIVALEASLAAMTQKHDALAGIKTGATKDPGTDGAGGEGEQKLPRFTLAQATAGEIPSALLRSGNYELTA